MQGVYALWHSGLRRAYVGRSNDVRRRLQEHRRALRKGRHHCVMLQALWSEDFKVLVLERDVPDEDLVALEQRWIDALRAVGWACNTLSTAFGSVIRHPKEFGEALRARQMGRSLSEAHRQAISEGKRGKPLTIAQRQGLSAAKRGKPVLLTPDACERQRMRTRKCKNQAQTKRRKQ
jgi:hypothetical protein